MPEELPSPVSVAELLRSKLPAELHQPVLAIVCGSGLAGLSDQLTDRVDVAYADIPGFQASTGQLNSHLTGLRSFSFSRLTFVSPPRLRAHI